MSSLEDMKEITTRLIFGQRQAVQLIDQPAPRGVRLLSTTTDNFSAEALLLLPAAGAMEVTINISEDFHCVLRHISTLFKITPNHLCIVP